MFKSMSSLTTAPQSFSRPKYRPDIDGMRALAILAVLFFHAYPESLPGGFVGVDIFFVISGYLISSIIFRGLDLGSFSFFDFYARRVRRIFPAVAFVLLGSFVLGFFLLIPYEFEEHLLDESPYAAFFLENWRLYVTTGGYWETATELKPLMHFWSLGVEEQYYIFYPLICYLLWKVSVKRFLACLMVMFLVSFVLCLYDTYNDSARAFYSLHSRFWQLLIGGVLAYVELQWPQYKKLMGGAFIREINLNNIFSLVGVLLIVFSLIFFEEGKYFPGWRALFPTIGGLLVIAAGTEAILNKYVFSNKLAVFVGLISYPLYLWHWPFICIARNNLGGELPTGFMMVVLIALSFLMAYLTFTLIERPMRSKKPTWQMILCLVMVLLFVSLGTKTAVRRSELLQHTLFAGMPESVQETLKDLPRSERNDIICTDVFGEGHSVCRSTSDKPSVLFFGDSHNYTMWDVLYNQGELPPFYIVGNGGGLIFDDVFVVSKDKKVNSALHEKTSRVWNAIRSHSEINTIVLRGNWVGNLSSTLISNRYPDIGGKNLIKQLWRDTFAELSWLNKQVIVVLDNISVPFNPLVRCVSSHRIDLKKQSNECWIPFESIDPKEYEIRDFLKAEAQKWDNVTIVDSWDALCDEKGCYLSNDNIPYYKDGNHLSIYGNRLVWDLIKKTVFGK